MAKVMLVEDDNNLREIYTARMQAEGYDVVTASDGEEALVVAKAEKPELVVSDVMMPKISGFEMLDILRNTDGLKDVKVIMLTALGQTDDQARADKLGADRYLVKSQVTLEDIVKAAHELLQDQEVEASEPAPVSAAAEAPVPAPAPAAEPVPVAAAPAEVPVAQPPAEPVASQTAPATPVEAAAANEQTLDTAVNNLVASTAEPAAPAPAPSPSANPAPVTTAPEAQSTAQEEASVEANIETFIAGASTDSSTPVAASPAPVEPAATPVAAQPAPVADSPVTQAADPAPAPEPVVTPTQAPAPANPAADEDTSNSSVPIANKKVIEPIDSEPKKDINTLLALEQAKEAANQPPPPPVAVVATNEGGAEKKPLITPAQSGTPPVAQAQQEGQIPADDPNSIAL